jgi:hypothetical protein
MPNPGPYHFVPGDIAETPEIPAEGAKTYTYRLRRVDSPEFDPEHPESYDPGLYLAPGLWDFQVRAVGEGEVSEWSEPAIIELPEFGVCTQIAVLLVALGALSRFHHRRRSR